MNYLFFDTETTGLPDFKKDINDPSQPRIIQLAALLTYESTIISELKCFIKPDGWIVPEEVEKIHGISTEKCEQYGIPMKDALHLFNAMKSVAKARVAHNISFDKVMMAREANAYGIEHNSEGLETFCTMQMSKPKCKIPPTDKMMAAGFKGFKSPNLQEAYKHFFGTEFDGAHDASEDVHACKDIFFEMRKQAA